MPFSPSCPTLPCLERVFVFFPGLLACYHLDFCRRHTLQHSKYIPDTILRRWLAAGVTAGLSWHLFHADRIGIALPRSDLECSCWDSSMVFLFLASRAVVCGMRLLFQGCVHVREIWPDMDDMTLDADVQIDGRASVLREETRTPFFLSSCCVSHGPRILMYLPILRRDLQSYYSVPVPVPALRGT
jgi:hypothetical protein